MTRIRKVKPVLKNFFKLFFPCAKILDEGDDGEYEKDARRAEEKSLKVEGDVLKISGPVGNKVLQPLGERGHSESDADADGDALPFSPRVQEVGQRGKDSENEEGGEMPERFADAERPVGERVAEPLFADLEVERDRFLPVGEGDDRVSDLVRGDDSVFVNGDDFGIRRGEFRLAQGRVLLIGDTDSRAAVPRDASRIVVVEFDAGIGDFLNPRAVLHRKGQFRGHRIRFRPYGGDNGCPRTLRGQSSVRGHVENCRVGGSEDDALTGRVRGEKGDFQPPGISDAEVSVRGTFREGERETFRRAGENNDFDFCRNALLRAQKPNRRAPLRERGDIPQRVYGDRPSLRRKADGGRIGVCAVLCFKERVEFLRSADIQRQRGHFAVVYGRMQSLKIPKHPDGIACLERTVRKGSDRNRCITGLDCAVIARGVNFEYLRVGGDEAHPFVRRVFGRQRPVQRSGISRQGSIRDKGEAGGGNIGDDDLERFRFAAVFTADGNRSSSRLSGSQFARIRDSEYACIRGGEEKFQVFHCLAVFIRSEDLEGERISSIEGETIREFFAVCRELDSRRYGQRDCGRDFQFEGVRMSVQLGGNRDDTGGNRRDKPAGNGSFA